ncbi:protealysin inhibitor emfourin [Saccharicrinis fermentans]|uniref:Uncharacterized protein n=1 Tax=Saccharicrinis fermentans DSM 9555 = JCM 21142 TaxID=869213 RepID=W7Y1C1_9BACT|nr:protealysin inhibitor emfourin [Saccharicrinis fermentans]GAF01752.1 hypothetical protein JCM21142_368 [Saccharicrinis fermentans DSM 9555 = JCM 21142]
MTNKFNISYERSGGFMGQTISCEVNSDELPHDLRNHLSEWLQHTPSTNLEQTPASDPYPDHFKYVLKINGHNMQEFTFSESDLPKKLIPLFNFLNLHTRQKQKKRRR